MMDARKIRAFTKRCLSLFFGILLVFQALMIVGQGCAKMDQYIQDTQREYALKDKMRSAEAELKRGNLVAARTLFEWVGKESKRSALKERALFFSGFCTLLDKGDRHRWTRARRIFLSVRERFPEGEFGQISAYFAEGLSDALSVAAGLQGDIESMQQKMDREKSHTGEKDQLVQKQKKELEEKTVQIAALKHSIEKKNKEIEDLKMQIKKLEEIHKEIKKKREDLG